MTHVTKATPVAAGDDQVFLFLLQEHQVLRDEMTKRIDLRQRILDLTIISAGAIFALESSNIVGTRLLLLYPILVMFLAASYVHQRLWLMKNGSYLREIVEPALSKMQDMEIEGEREGKEYKQRRKIGYETDLMRYSHFRQNALGDIASIGLFMSVQLASLAFGFAASVTDIVGWNGVFTLLSSISIIVTLLIWMWKIPQDQIPDGHSEEEVESPIE